jgi:sugar O-acyltransferase (sialic acid O-acetyltransferase NeuD family)
MSALFIYCAGGFGKEVMDVAIRFNAANQRWTSIFFLDDFCETSTRYDTKVFKFDKACEWLQKNEGMVIIATGEPSARAMLRSKLEGKGVTLDTLIDTTTVVADSARIESGVVITAFCSVSSDAVIQLNASVNTMSIVGHDVLVGENTVISSMVNIGGETKIGRNSYIGMGALIKEGVTIGNDVIIGMGSVVYNDIPDNMIALGNPARPMRSNDNKKVFR